MSGRVRQLRAGFTLVELVVVLTIVVVLAGLAIPTFLGLRDEGMARAPLSALEDLVAKVRERAEVDGRAYEIVFDREGFFAMPRAGVAEGREALRERFRVLGDPPDRGDIERQMVARAEVSGVGDAAVDQATAVAGELELGREREVAAGYEVPFLESYVTGEAIGVEVLFWGDPDWTAVENEAVRRWVFQPGGLVHPVRVRFSAERAFFEAGFDALTAGTVGERSNIGEGVE